jgi:hypothetical protein
MAGFDTFGVGELPDIVIARGVAIKTCFDTGAKVCDLREEQVDFCSNTCYIETVYIYRQ